MGSCVSVETASALLHRAAATGDLQTLLRVLRDHHLEIDSLDQEYQSPLHKAVANQHFECARVLVEYGANVSLRNGGMFPKLCFRNDFV